VGGQDGLCSIGKLPDPSSFQSRALFAGLEQSEGAPKLWFAVLAQAFRDYYGDIPSEGPTRYRKGQLQYCQRTARAWFLSDSASMGSFRWIADLFELDVQAVRKRLFSGSCIDFGEIIEESVPQASSTIEDVAIDDVSTPNIEPATLTGSAPLEVMVAAWASRTHLRN
jgi:hypothetical protein